MDTDLTQLVTQAGAAGVVIILAEVLKRAAALSEAAWHRFGALIAIVLGIATVTVANYALLEPVHIVQAGFTGILAGAAASGIYQLGSRVMASTDDAQG